MSLPIPKEEPGRRAMAAKASTVECSETWPGGVGPSGPVAGWGRAERWADKYLCCWGTVRAKSGAAALTMVECVLLTVALLAVPTEASQSLVPVGAVVAQLVGLAVVGFCLWAALYGLSRDRASFLLPQIVLKATWAGFNGVAFVAGLVGLLCAPSEELEDQLSRLILLVMAVLVAGFVYNLWCLLVLLKAQTYIRDKVAHCRAAQHTLLPPYPPAQAQAQVHQSPYERPPPYTPYV